MNNSTHSPEEARETHRPFMGREPQLRMLWEAFELLQQRRRSAFVLTGKPGVGKSATLDEFVRRVEKSSDAIVLSATCYRQTMDPYHVINQWMESLCRQLPSRAIDPLNGTTPSFSMAIFRLFPAFVPIAPPRSLESGQQEGYRKELRWDAFHDLRDLLTFVAKRNRLVLAIDNLQWADTDSLDLLRSMLRHADQPAAMLIGCCDNDDFDDSEPIRSLIGVIGNARQICLDPLSVDDTCCLALKWIDGQRSSSVEHELAKHCAKESGGNPLFLRELIQRSLQGAVSPIAQRVSIERIIWNRVQTLPDQSRFLVQVLCVAGRPLPLGLALEVAGISSANSASLQILFDRHLTRNVIDSGRTLIDVDHERLRDIVVSRLGNELQTQCRMRLTEFGEIRVPNEMEFLAAQYLALRQSASAVNYCSLAADRAAERLAFHQAAKFYAEGIAQSSNSDSRRISLRAALADALSNAGRSTEAAREYLRLAESLTGAAALDVQRQAFTQFLQTGRIHEGVSILKEVLDKLGISFPSTTRSTILRIQLTRLQLRLRGMRFRLIDEEQIPPAELLRIDVLWSVAVCLRRVDMLRGVAFGARACLEAIRVGERNRIARGLALEGVHLAVPGRRSQQRAELLIDTARRLVEGSQDQKIRTQVTMCTGITAALLGQWKACLMHSEQAEDGFRSNEVGEITTSRFWQMSALLWLGRLAELQQRCTTLVESAEERGDLYEIVSLGTYTLTMARLAQDRPQIAREEMQSIMDRWTREEFQVQHHLEVIAKASILLYEGNFSDASFLLQQSVPLHKSSLVWGAHLVRANVLHLQVRIALKRIAEDIDPNSSIHQVRQALQALRREKLPWTNALATMGEASLEQLTGNIDDAKSKFEHAMESLRELDMELYSAISRRRLGQILGGAEGRELIHQADATIGAQNIADVAKMTELLLPSPVGTR